MSPHPLIALWSHPRSMSTATERIMRERGDCTCFHEPFIYDYYLARGVRELPHFAPDPEHPVAYEQIRDMLIAQAEQGPVFFKDMSYYVVPRIFDDEPFVDRIKHLFLIRDPRRAIASFHRLDPDLISEEIGLEAQWQHVEFLERRTGRPPLIVEAETIQADPAATAARIFAACGLPPCSHATEWSSGQTPDGWGDVAGWHGDVLASQGIRAPKQEADATEVFEAAAKLAPRLRELLNHHWPYYERLKARAG